jgi:hypothetical protein
MDPTTPPEDPAEEPVPGHPLQERDHLPFAKIVLTAAAAVVVFTVGILWAWGILRGPRPDLRGPGSVMGAARIGQAEIGIVDQVPFASAAGPEPSRAEAARHLASYGWVDRRRGIIHVPVEQAIERLLRAAGGAR